MKSLYEKKRSLLYTLLDKLIPTSALNFVVIHNKKVLKSPEIVTTKEKKNRIIIRLIL